MAVLLLRGVRKAYGAKQVLRDVDLIIEPGQRVGVVGVNGSGKSTLLKIAAGLLEADAGEFYRTRDVVCLDQDPQLPGTTVGEAAEDALLPQHALIEEHRQVAEKLAEHDDPKLGEHLAELHARIERGGGWDLSHRVDAMLHRVDAPPREALLKNLSGGERRRVALARVLLASPELLILDEPTNHLDADTVQWLQGTLQNYAGAVLLVTHDRYFLDEVVERIVEVEDGCTVSYEGGYGDYLVSKVERSEMLRKGEERRMRLIATEAEWAARKPGAQRKHDRARLSRLEALKAQRPILRQATASFGFAAGEKLGGSILETRALTIRRGERTLIKELDLSLNRGDRLGVIGPNGAGKTTLLKLLTGEVRPDSGSVVLGKRVKMAVFSQERAELDPRFTVKEAVGGAEFPGAVVPEVVSVNGQDLTLSGYLEQFLFSHDQHQSRLSTLSGGEKARVLLARLVRQGANLLLLDEPTNDLDLMTLRVLEQALMEYNGCAMVVTHDRWFLDRVATGVLAFEGDGKVVRYADFAQHRRAVEAREAAELAIAREKQAEIAAAQRAARRVVERKQRLSFKEQKELEEMPARIEKVEARKLELETKLADATLYRGPAAALKAVQDELAKLNVEIPRMYARWEEMEARK